MARLLPRLLLAALPLITAGSAWGKDPARIFRARCAACHGEDGRGQTEIGLRERAPDLTSERFQAERSDEAIKLVITKGKPGTKMSGYGETLSPEEIEGLVKVIRGLKGGGAAK